MVQSRKNWHTSMPSPRLDESDVENLELSRFSRSRINVQSAVIRRLQASRSDKLFSDFVGCFHQSQIKPDVEEAKRKDGGVNPRRLMNQCIRTWRAEQNFVLNSVAKQRESQRIVQAAASQPNIICCKKQSNKYSAKPDLFRLHEIMNAAKFRKSDMTCEANSKDAEMPESEILRRPSQLVELQETDAGSSQDNLKDARKALLAKLSKKCAYQMVHRNTPFEHREQLEKDLEAVHGLADEENSYSNNDDLI